MEKEFIAGDRAVATKGAAAHEGIAAPAPVDEMEARSMMFSALADVEARADRRHDALARRITKLENRGGLFNLPEELKGFLLMLTLYVGVTIVLPEMARLVREWRQS